GQLVIRADGGPGIGSGHLGRCLALAEQWCALGGDLKLVTKAAPRMWEERFRALGEIEGPYDGWQRAEAAWVVLDGYDLGQDEQRRVKEAGRRLLVIDDHGSQGGYEADIVLDHNLDATPASYHRIGPDTELLLGAEYVLLRREFAGAASPSIPPEARRLLVLLGGSPPDGLVETVASAVASSGLDVRQLDGSTEVAVAMAAADLALAGAGVTAWELCAMGIPSLLVVVAPNQLPVAAALHRVEAAVSLGEASALNADRLGAELRSLAQDPDRRRHLSTNGRRLFDGRGARRVVARLHARMLDLTPVTLSHARLLWEWANEPGVRSAAFSPATIPWDDHVRWLESQVADLATHFYVASRDGEPVGQVRFSVEDDHAEVHISVRVDARRQGVGPALIAAGSRQLFADAPVRKVEARIRPDNVASIGAFLDAGYRADGEGSDGGTRWLRYSLVRDASSS
ncbi:MAG TPA: GNAT family N-acetyltransferase, partial [Nocardioides sp.]|nr:GNAT family N-acetyltransferase [Nocardioides sp.]